MDPQAIIEIFRRNVMEHYFDLNGRVSREEFWYFFLASVIVGIVAGIVDAVIHTGLVGPVVGLALTLPLAGMGARRLQDTGKPGSMVWYFIIPAVVNRLIALLIGLSGPFAIVGLLALLPLVGLIGFVTLIAAVWIGYLCAQPGVSGNNQYGPEPKSGSSAAAT
jgi:uncharacterized membrane protein YhaH (DUF805 family)